MNINGRFDGRNIITKGRCAATLTSGFVDVGGAALLLDQQALLGIPAKLGISSSSVRDSAAQTLSAIGGTSRSWYGICCDLTGALWATVNGGDIYRCPPGSTTFTAIGGTSRNWYGICCDPSGTLWATVVSGDIYTCPAGSTTFTAIGGTSRTWSGICSDLAGNIWATVNGGDIYMCPAGSTTFTAIGGASLGYAGICCDPSGNLWATVSGVAIYKCPAGSSTFTSISGTSRGWYGICSDPSGNIWAVVNSGDVYKCPAGSTTFTAIGGGPRSWWGICSDLAGNIWAFVNGGDIYTFPGFGARTLFLLGLGATGQFQTETIALNGQSVVTTVNTWYRLFFARCLTTGTDLANAGDLYIVKTGTGGTYTNGVPGVFTIASAILKILLGATDGGSTWYTTPFYDPRPVKIPALLWQVDQIDVSINTAAAGGIIVLLARDLANNEAPIREEAFYLPSTGGTFSFDLRKYELIYGPNTDIRVLVMTNTAGAVSAGMSITKLNY
jgi:hypothetical protein